MAEFCFRPKGEPRSGKMSDLRHIESTHGPAVSIPRWLPSGEFWWSANTSFLLLLACEMICVAKNVTKAGVRAEVNEQPSPVVVFVARDHHSSEYFANIKEGQSLKVRVIGQRFELNDRFVSVIAEVIEPREEKQRQRRKPKLVIQE